MGGMVTVVARYKNKETIAFKTSTNFFHYHMNSPLLLNEDYFREKVKEYDFLRDDHLPETDAEEYNCRKGVKAPYEYGMILIDYYQNMILSCNNFSAMIRGNSAKLLQEYADFLPSDFILKFTSYGKNDSRNIDIRNERFMDYQELHLIHMALKNKAVIKKSFVEVKNDGTIESVLENIYGISLKNKSKEEQLSIINEYFEKEKQIKFEKYGDKYVSSLEDYSDIKFDYSQMIFIEGNGAEDSKIIFKYMNNNEFRLSDYEKQIWKKHLSEQEQKKGKNRV